MKPLSNTRRDFLKRSSAGGLALAAIAAGPLMNENALAQAVGGFGAIDKSKITTGDIAMLKFLAAAELVEADLWAQYCELAVGNEGFNEALRRIDPSLVRYICDDGRDELSHANLINGFLVAIGEQAINLDSFRTLPPSGADGAANRGRLTSLAKLNVDTSWFLRYRSEKNTDIDGTNFPQLVDISGVPTVPTSGKLRRVDYDAAAHAAAFHFCAIEQGGGSLYTSLLPKTSSPDVTAVLAAIGPTEISHFTAFHQALGNMRGFISSSGIRYPNLRDNQELADGILPTPCSFFRPGLPVCSVIRPGATQNAGAVAAATGLVKSGLFTGQTPQFFDAVTALAVAADKAVRA